MSEITFAYVIEEWAKRDWESYADTPEIKTSKKHNRAMQRIFKRYERNTRKFRPHLEIRIRTIRRRITVALLVIILAVITGFTAAYFISQSFRGKVHSDSTELFPIDTENCPIVIEERYYLPELPEGFELLSSSPTPFSETIIYKNDLTGQTITFGQWTKPDFDSTHYNTEKGELVEIEINGHSGVLLDVSTDTRNATIVIWDNGKYILELFGNLTKSDLLDLAKSAKKLENYIVRIQN